MNAILDNTFMTLIGRLCALGQPTNGHPQMTEADRPLALAGLERLLVDLPALDEHTRYLQKRFGQTFPDQDLLPEEQVERIVSQGAGVLSNDELSVLLLNPIALRDLAFHIAEALPDFWLEQMSEAGRQVMQAEGIVRKSSGQRAWVLRMAPGGVNRVPDALRDNDLIIGWSCALGLLNPDLDWPRFRQIIHDRYYPEDKDQRRAGRAAGNLWRFVREMQVGDLVVVPDRSGFYVSVVAGLARSEQDKLAEDTAHRRKVFWLNGKKPIARRIARTALQSRMTVLGTCTQATDLLPDIRDAIEQAQQPTPPTFATDLHTRLVEHTLDELRSGRMNDHGFEVLVRELMLALGAKDARVVARRHDKGGDVVATFPVAGAFEFTVAIQAKHYQPKPPVQPTALDQLIGGMEAESADLGMVVTTGTFDPATEAAAAKLRDEQGLNIELVDGPQLAALLVQVGVRG